VRHAKLLIINFAIALLLGNNNCVGASEPQAKNSNAVLLRDGVVRLDGRIDSSLARAFESQIAGQDIREVVITSLGGEDLSAIAIGRLIQSHHLTVTVDGVCMSACASYIFSAAANQKILPDSLVIFHHTGSSLLKLTYGSDKIIRDEYLTVAKNGEALLKLNGVSESLLVQPQLEMMTLCYGYFAKEKDEPADIIYSSVFQGWIPSRTYLKNAGLHVQGYWPSTPSQLAADLKRIFPSDPAFKVVFGGSGEIPASVTLDSQYRKIPKCVMNH
jgi:ATP-dependent protease ClpP protease subunit